jgi:hypothetical protein
MRARERRRVADADAWLGYFNRLLRRRKYPPLDAVAKPEPAKATMREGNQLAKLVRKYGAKAVIDLVRVIEAQPPRKRERGAPSKIDERMWLTGLIDEWAEENRQAGSRHPLRDAMLDVYGFEYCLQKPQPDVQKFLAATKKKLLQGRREIREYREHLEHLSQHDPSSGIRAEARSRLAALSGPK